MTDLKAKAMLSVLEETKAGLPRDSEAVAKITPEELDTLILILTDYIGRDERGEALEEAAKWHDEEAKRVTLHWEEHKGKYVRAGSDAVLFVADVKKWHINSAEAIRALRSTPPATEEGK